MTFKTWNDSGVGSELERFILSHSSLKTGDKLEGKVIQVKVNGNLLIDFGNFRAVAETRFPMKEGEIINVVVLSKRPKLKLKLEAPQSGLEPGKENVIHKLDMSI
jgi:hypothetical protein